MDIILSSLLSFLLLYKYVGLFAVSFLAALLLPLPSSSTLAAAGAFSAQGYFSIETVLLVAFFGNVTGDTAGYLLARHYGIKTLRNIGFAKIIVSKNYELCKDYLHHFSYSLIFFSRFLTAIGPLVNILAGITHTRYRIFCIVGILGEIAYVLLYGLVGYFLGSEWENNLSFLFEATFVVISLGLTLSALQYRVFKRMKRGSQTV